MKPTRIDWKGKTGAIEFRPSWQDKTKLVHAANDTIDLLRKKHKLSPIQCAIILDFLRSSLADTIAEFMEAKE